MLYTEIFFFFLLQGREGIRLSQDAIQEQTDWLRVFDTTITVCLAVLFCSLVSPHGILLYLVCICFDIVLKVRFVCMYLLLTKF